MGRYFKLPAASRPIDYMFRENTPLMMKVLEANDRAISQRMLELQKEREAIEFETAPQDEDEATKMVKKVYGNKIKSIAEAMRGDLPNWRKYRTQIQDLGTELQTSMKSGDIYKYTQNYAKRKTAFEDLDAQVKAGKLTGYEANRFKEYYDENYKGVDLAHGGKGVYSAEAAMDDIDIPRLMSEGIDKLKSDPSNEYSMTPQGAYFFDKHTQKRERLTPEKIIAFAMSNLGTKGSNFLAQRQRVGLINGVYDPKTLEPIKAFGTERIPMTKEEAAEIADWEKGLAKMDGKDVKGRAVVSAAIQGYKDAIANREKVTFNNDSYLGPILNNLVNVWSKDLITEDGHELVTNQPALQFGLQSMRSADAAASRAQSSQQHRGDMYRDYRACLDRNQRLRYQKASILGRIDPMDPLLEENLQNPPPAEHGWFGSDEESAPVNTGPTNTEQIRAITDTMVEEDCSIYMSEGTGEATPAGGGGNPPAQNQVEQVPQAYGGDVYAYGGSVGRRERYDTGGLVDKTGAPVKTQIVDYNRPGFKAKKVEVSPGKFVSYYSNEGLSHTINDSKTRIAQAAYKISEIDKELLKAGTGSGLIAQRKQERNNWTNMRRIAEADLNDARINYSNIAASAMIKADKGDLALYNDKTWANDRDGTKYREWIEKTLVPKDPGKLIGAGAAVVRVRGDEVQNAYKKLRDYMSAKKRIDALRNEEGRKMAATPIVGAKALDFNDADSKKYSKLLNDNVDNLQKLRLFDVEGNDTYTKKLKIPGGLPGPDNNEGIFSFDGTSNIIDYIKKTGSQIVIHRLGAGGDMGTGGAVAEISFVDNGGELPKGKFFLPLDKKTQRLLGEDIRSSTDIKDPIGKEVGIFARDITHPVYQAFAERMKKPALPEDAAGAPLAKDDVFDMMAPNADPNGQSGTLRVRRFRNGDEHQFFVSVPNDDGTETPFPRVKIDDWGRAELDDKNQFIIDSTAGKSSNIKSFGGKFNDVLDLYTQYAAQTGWRQGYHPPKQAQKK